MKKYLLIAFVFGVFAVKGQSISMTATGSNTQSFGALPTTGSVAWTDNYTFISCYFVSSTFSSSIVITDSNSCRNFSTSIATDRAIGALSTSASTHSFESRYINS